MKKLFSIYLSLFLVLSVSAEVPDYWNLIFEDNFSGDSFDTNSWSYAPRQNSQWNKYLTNSDKTVMVKDGNLIVKAIMNPDKSVDKVPYLTGGIKSMGKFGFRYGKVEVRAKCSMGQGSFPAIWMMPEDQSKGWPNDGEIDIMEVLNFDGFTYQTVHTNFTYNLGIKNPPSGTTKAINKNDYNIYGLEWYPDRLDFYVNGERSFTYPKIVTDKEGQWPFDKPFHIILNQATGDGSAWVGGVKEADLPYQMQVDWVRVYQLDENAPYDTPAFSTGNGKAQGDVHWKDTYVKSITSEGASNNLDYKATARPDSYYTLLPDTLHVTENETLSLNFQAFSLGAYNENTVLQDLRYTCAYVYADFDNDKSFEVSLDRVGKLANGTPKIHGVGGNIETMDFTALLPIPAVDKTQTGRIRVVYHNAWSQRASANTPVAEGLVYDINVKIAQKQTGIVSNQFKPQVYRNANKLHISDLQENCLVSVIDFTGKTISKTLSTSSTLEQSIPAGFCIVKVQNKSGEVFSTKL